MDNEETPKIPTLKESSKKPSFKFKGFAAGASLMERLKQFKKKDLAFILAGLGVLFMAPLAEHFLMSPDNADSGAFKEGWGFRDGAAGFGKGGSPYEPGVSGLAPGGVTGGATDIITPLNVRDPSALVMGPGATQQPPTQAPPAKESSDWKDALANAGAKAASEATKKGGLPVPKVPLSAGSLRGLGAATGGGGGTYTLPPISAANVPNAPEGGSSLSNVRPIPGYRGAAGPRSLTGGGSSIEGLKKAAEQAGADFTKPGSAATNLETAASREMKGGGGSGEGAGQQGKQGEDKAAAQSQDKGSKSTGESLEFLRIKQEQEKAIDLKWKLKEKQALLWPDLKQKMLEEAIMTPWKKQVGLISDQLKDLLGGKDTVYQCVRTIGSPSYRAIKKDDIAKCNVAPDKEGKEKGGVSLWTAGEKTKEPSGWLIVYSDQECTKLALYCGGADDAKAEPPPQNTGIEGMPGIGKEVAQHNPYLKELCDKKPIPAEQKGEGTVDAKNKTSSEEARNNANTAIGHMNKAAGRLAIGGDAITGEAPPAECKVGSARGSRRPLLQAFVDFLERLGSATVGAGDAVKAVGEINSQVRNAVNPAADGILAAFKANNAQALQEPLSQLKKIAETSFEVTVSREQKKTGKLGEHLNKDAGTVHEILLKVSPSDAKGLLFQAAKDLEELEALMGLAIQAKTEAENEIKAANDAAAKGVGPYKISEELEKLVGVKNSLGQAVNMLKVQIEYYRDNIYKPLRQSVEAEQGSVRKLYTDANVVMYGDREVVIQGQKILPLAAFTAQTNGIVEKVKAAPANQQVLQAAQAEFDAIGGEGKPGRATYLYMDQQVKKSDDELVKLQQKFAEAPR